MSSPDSIEQTVEGVMNSGLPPELWPMVIAALVRARPYL